MPLPAPHLDDRTFQSLVDDAKRMVQQRCPAWTDHNVSDPGVTLIETFAYMVDQVVWRLNRVPDKAYVKFLDLLGLQLAPPSAARANVTFWLSAVQEHTVDVPAGTEVATPRGEDEPVVFSTLADLPIVDCALQRVATEVNNTQEDRTDELAAGRPVACFEAVPRPGDCFYVGLTKAVPSCAVGLRFDCQVAGVGVDPRFPPLVWEAWTGGGWVACEVDRDGTGALNMSGEVVIHVPRTHQVHAGVVRQSAGWLRCRVVENAPWPTYEESPRITALEAYTLGGTVPAVNAEIVNEEMIGTSDGVPAQRFPLRNRPVVPGDEPYVLEVSGEEGWEEWTAVDGFGDSGPDDRHFMLEETAGEVVFGPAVREPDGSLTCYGAAPNKGSQIRIRSYRTGGGRQGNVARGALSVLKSSVPLIDTVGNRAAAAGGTDGEDLEAAKIRGPILLRTRQRAVTPEDYEHLALAAAREVARVRCVPAGTDGVEAGGARVLLVPHVEDGELGSVEFGQLVPSEEIYRKVADALDQRRTIGARVLVRAPGYVGMSVVASIRARPRANPERLEQSALEALYRYFHPVRGGPDGDGWPFGRSVVTGEVHAVLQRIRGVDVVEEVRLYPANPIERTRDKRAERIDLGPNDLVFSWGNQIMVQSA
ncbi:MAG TPA: putative baseplate assembly protein [Acidimicrobiales bacterium]|nr:putative baseplate assembly protein [Acidimicrobiales bacterium]